MAASVVARELGRGSPSARLPTAVFSKHPPLCICSLRRCRRLLAFHRVHDSAPVFIPESVWNRFRKINLCVAARGIHPAVALSAPVVPPGRTGCADKRGRAFLLPGLCIVREGMRSRGLLPLAAVGRRFQREVPVGWSRAALRESPGMRRANLPRGLQLIDRAWNVVCSRQTASPPTSVSPPPPLPEGSGGRLCSVGRSAVRQAFLLLPLLPSLYPYLLLSHPLVLLQAHQLLH